MSVKLTTQLITTEIPFPESHAGLSYAIAAALKQYGIPLRWAITQVKPDRQTMVIEAIITYFQ